MERRTKKNEDKQHKWKAGDPERVTTQNNRYQKGKRHKQRNISKSKDTKITHRRGIRAEIRVSRKKDTKVEKARKSRERSNV